VGLIVGEGYTLLTTRHNHDVLKVKLKDIGKLEEAPRVLKSNFSVDQRQQFQLRMDDADCTSEQDHQGWHVQALENQLLSVSLLICLGKHDCVEKMPSEVPYDNRISTPGKNPDANVVTGTFLPNNHYALILFDTGTDRSFVSTEFSSLIDIILTTLDHGYDVELADEMGSFDVIIGMDWLSKYHVKTEDKSEEKRLEDVPIIRDFPEVFPEDLPGIPPTRQVEFQIDLIPGAAHVARTPYRLAPSEMKELSDQLQELSDKGFIRPSSSPWGALKELNMRKRHWLELISYYNYEIRYHPGKANVVVDALSRKERIKPLRVQALVMTISLDLPKQNLEAQTTVRKPENLVAEDVGLWV
nr:hypothetical protein [Tanacetum cinerariifolium]